MAGLRAAGGPAVIDLRLAGGRPVLGVCVGMQVLFDGSDEPSGAPQDGLGEWPGSVSRLQAEVVPHMGWSDVAVAAGSRLFAGVESERFYFVHSYAVAVLEDGGAHRRLRRRGAQGHLGGPRWDASSRRSRTAPWRPRSSTLRSPGMQDCPSWRTGSGHCERDEEDREVGRHDPQADLLARRRPRKATPAPSRHDAPAPHHAPDHDASGQAEGRHDGRRGPGNPGGGSLRRRVVASADRPGGGGPRGWWGGYLARPGSPAATPWTQRPSPTQPPAPPRDHPFTAEPRTEDPA